MPLQFCLASVEADPDVDARCDLRPEMLLQLREASGELLRIVLVIGLSPERSARSEDSIFRRWLMTSEGRLASSL